MNIHESCHIVSLWLKSSFFLGSSQTSCMDRPWSTSSISIFSSCFETQELWAGEPWNVKRSRPVNPVGSNGWDVHMNLNMTSKGYSTEASAGSSLITLQHQPPFKWSPNLLRTLRQPNSSRAETTIMGESCHNSPWRQLDLALLTAPCVFLHSSRVFQSWPGRSIGHLEEVPTLHLGVHISQEHPIDPVTSNFPKKGNTELLAARQTQPSLVPVVALDGEHVQFRPWGSLHGNWWNLNVHGLSLRLSKT